MIYCNVVYCRYEKTAFQQEVQQRFDALQDSSWTMLDASKSIEELQSEVCYSQSLCPTCALRQNTGPELLSLAPPKTLMSIGQAHAAHDQLTESPSSMLACGLTRKLAPCLPLIQHKGATCCISRNLHNSWADMRFASCTIVGRCKQQLQQPYKGARQGFPSGTCGEQHHPLSLASTTHTADHQHY